MVIDSTQIAMVVIDSVADTAATTSVHLVEAYPYQPIVDAISKTDWWMFGITALNILAFIILTITIWWTNKKQVKTQIDIQKSELKLSLRKEYYELHTLLLAVRTQIDSLWISFLIPASICDIGGIRNDILSIYNRLLKQNESIDTLLSPEDAEAFRRLVLSISLFHISLSRLNDIFKSGASGFLTLKKIGDAKTNEDRIKLMDSIFEHYMKSEDLYQSGVVERTVKDISQNKLCEITEKYCNIYNMTK